MKKLFFAFTIILFANAAYAQFILGAKGGVNISKVYTDAGSLKSNYQQSLETKTGFNVGLYARVGDKFFLQPEVLFATKGGKVDVIPTNGGTPFRVDIKTNNLDIPILLGVKVLDKRIRIMAGPVASLKLSEDKKFAEQLKAITGDVNSAFENSTFGYQAGIGFKLLGLDFDIRKDGSLSEISSAKFGNDAKFNQRLSGWQFTVGFKII